MQTAGGCTAFNEDMMFMDHSRLGYPDDDGPGNAPIGESGGLSAPPRRCTPIIVIRQDNTTAVSTNVSGNNCQMKVLERAFGV